MHQVCALDVEEYPSRIAALHCATCADIYTPACACAGDNGKPGIVSLVPGGTITYENRNLLGNAASIAASINTKNFLAPADDLSFRVQYSQVWCGVCSGRQLCLLTYLDKALRVWQRG